MMEQLIQLQWKSACISMHQLVGSWGMPPSPLPPPPPPKKIRCPGIGFEAISGSDLIGHQQTGQICSGLLYTSTRNSAKSCFIKFCVASNTVAIPVCENQLCYYVSSITAPQESQCGQECEEVPHYSLQN